MAKQESNMTGIMIKIKEEPQDFEDLEYEAYTVNQENLTGNYTEDDDSYVTSRASQSQDELNVLFIKEEKLEEECTEDRGTSEKNDQSLDGVHRGELGEAMQEEEDSEDGWIENEDVPETKIQPLDEEGHPALVVREEPLYGDPSEHERPDHWTIEQSSRMPDSPFGLQNMDQSGKDNFKMAEVRAQTKGQRESSSSGSKSSMSEYGSSVTVASVPGMLTSQSVFMECADDQHKPGGSNETSELVMNSNEGIDMMSVQDKNQKSNTGEGLYYQCIICDAKYSHNRYLTEHMKTHTEKRPYKCPVCDKGFAKKYYIKRHLRTHTGEKPFFCTICNDRFAQKASLVEHVRSHINRSPFHCPICNSAFSRKYGVKRHMKTHNLGNP